MSSAAEDALERLGHFVRASLSKPELHTEDNIFTVGEASSLYSMELVMFIEDDLGYRLDDADLERDHFETIGAMARLVDRKSRGE